MFRLLLFVLLSLVLFLSCRSFSENNHQGLSRLEIERKIESPFCEKFTYFDDSLKREVEGTMCFGCIVSRLDVTGDGIKDYFVIEDRVGGTTFGYFYDGQTGDTISFDFSSDIISRPGCSIQYQCIDVNCSDNQKELLVRTRGGGTLGHGFGCAIYRYNKNTSKMEVIFSELMSYLDVDSNQFTDVNYIDVKYNDSSCVQQITVQRGEFIEQERICSLNIKPIDSSVIFVHEFNNKRNLFELKD